MRLKLGIVAEANDYFLNQVKLCIFSLRKNGGVYSDIPITLITNADSLDARERQFFTTNFSPIDFKVAPRLGAIRHTSKLNVFYSIDPRRYDVLLYLDCDTVVRERLDSIIDPIIRKEFEFICRRGGKSDRGNFYDFQGLVDRYAGRDCTNKVLFEGEQEWPMFNSGVFAGTARAVRRIRRDSVEITYDLFNEWQRIDALCRLPDSIKKMIESEATPEHTIRQKVGADWTIEQGALALSCIKSGVRVGYLDGLFNSWGGEPNFKILHCFKSLYKFDRRTMYKPDSESWIEEYIASDVPGKRFLAEIVREYKRTFTVYG